MTQHANRSGRHHDVQRVRARAMAVLRVLAYAVVMVALLALLISRKVMAEIGEQSLTLGESLGPWSSVIGPSTAVTLNGQELFVGSMTVPMSIEDVLDRFSDLCVSSTDDTTWRTTALAETSAKTSAETALLRKLLVARRSTDKRGAAACLAGAADDGVAGLPRRFAVFAQTRDLGTIGELRYLTVTKAARGSHVVAVWNRGSLEIDALFPKHGDAPGADFFEGARPTHSRRILSAEVERSEHRLSMYESQVAATAALDSYAQALAAKGYQAAPRARTEANPSRIFMKEGRALLVTARPNAQGSMLSVLELARYAPIEGKEP